MRHWLGAAAFLFSSQAIGAPPALSCEQAAFAAVVADAGSALSAMNDENKKALQGKLHALGAREGWSDTDYAAKAVPFVKDAAIAAFDETNAALLGQVSSLGGRADETLAPAELQVKRCAMLGKLRTVMAKVVENMRTKWAHMLGRVDAALESSAQAKMAGH